MEPDVVVRNTPDCSVDLVKQPNCLDDHVADEVADETVNDASNALL